MADKKPNIPGTGANGAPGDTKAAVSGLQQEQDQEFVEDFQDEDGGGDFALASEGKHPAKVIDFEKSTSKTGNPLYIWQFLITSGDSEGIEVRFWTSLLPQARWKTVQTLEAVGVKAAGTVARFTQKDIIGKPCIIDVIHDEYDNRTTHKVDRVYPADEAAVRAAKPDADKPAQG